VEELVQINDLWPYQLSQIYYEPSVTAAVEKMAEEELSTAAV
jgi:hypothetical protein